MPFQVSRNVAHHCRSERKAQFNLSLWRSCLAPASSSYILLAAKAGCWALWTQQVSHKCTPASSVLYRREWRLIIDLSHPEGGNTNGGISEARSALSYVTIQDAAKAAVLFGEGALLAKVDVKSAYRNIPVHPEDR